MVGVGRGHGGGTVGARRGKGEALVPSQEAFSVPFWHKNLLLAPNVNQQSLTYFKTECTHCGGAIEFDAGYLGEMATCPHCGGRTLLLAANTVHFHRVGGRRFP